MQESIAQILPYGVAVALSPMPIAALLLMLLSNRAKINSVAFTIGWIAGLAILVWVVSSLVGLSAGETKQATGFSMRALIDGILGVILILLSIKQWKNRPKNGKTPATPGWMKTIETFSPAKAFGIGFLLATVNVKNTPVGIAVGSVISAAGIAGTSVFIVYLILAGCTIWIPTLGFLVLGQRIESTLTSLKNWLIYNNATIMFVLFLILGIMLISKAFGW